MPASSRRWPPSPTSPSDLEADLIGFAVRLNRNCICNRDGKFLRKLIQTEGERYPELFAGWREHGPAQDLVGTGGAFRAARPCPAISTSTIPISPRASSWR